MLSQNSPNANKRAQLVQAHGEAIVSLYEESFPDELDLFDERYCGHIGDFSAWAQDVLDDAYCGFEEDDKPCLQAFIEMELSDYFIYDEELDAAFRAR